MFNIFSFLINLLLGWSLKLKFRKFELQPLELIEIVAAWLALVLDSKKVLGSIPDQCRFPLWGQDSVRDILNLRGTIRLKQGFNKIESCKFLPH